MRGEYRSDRAPASVEFPVAKEYRETSRPTLVTARRSLWHSRSAALEERLPGFQPREHFQTLVNWRKGEEARAKRDEGREKERRDDEEEEEEEEEEDEGSLRSTRENREKERKRRL